MPVMLILLLISALVRLLYAAPVSSTPPPVYDAFELCLCTADMTNPHLATREVRDIIVSCLATIFACTWTTIHPNVPAPNESGWQSLKRRVITMIYALLAPEAITGWAWRQKIVAQEIAWEYNYCMDLDKSKIPKELTFFGKLGNSVIEWIYGPHLPSKVVKSDARPWTTTHGFFLQMGGFMMCKEGVPYKTLRWYDESDGGDNEFFYGKFQTGFLDAPTTTEAEIKDRSKGDFLSKAIIILQTTWFIAQCIGRWAAHLPVTELEVITLGFAALNALTYWLWWKKPQSVGQPVYLEILDELAGRDSPASSARNGSTDMNDGEIQEGGTHPMESMGDVEPATVGPVGGVQLTETGAEPGTELGRGSAEGPAASGPVWGADNAAIPVLGADTPNKLEEAADGYEGGGPQSVDGSTAGDVGPTGAITTSGTENEVSSGLTGWLISYYGRVKSELSDLWHQRNQTTPSQSHFGQNLKANTWSSFLVAPIAAVLRPLAKLLQFTSISIDKSKTPLRVSVFSSDGLVDITPIYIASSLIAAGFGLIHFIPSWFLDFRSQPERLLWRISAAIITGEPILLAIWSRLDRYISARYACYNKPYPTSFKAFQNVVFYIGIPLYIIARVALITLAFTSLRRLPHGALVAIDWISFVPHF